MKQMSSGLVDREERKHSLISKDTTFPCWISIQHSCSRGVVSLSTKGRAGLATGPPGILTALPQGHNPPVGNQKSLAPSWRLWGKLGAASEVSEGKCPP